MERLFTRDNKPTPELQEVVTKTIKGIEIKYTEVYYLDYEVNETTGIINRNKKVKHYTKRQVERNLEVLKKTLSFS